MPVFGYLALPADGALENLSSDLSSLPWCEILPSENREVLILITDTPDESAEKKLQKKLLALESLQTLSMTFGHVDEPQPETMRKP